MKPKKTSKKVILISGGSRGLGAVLVRDLLEKTAATVISFSRSETPFVKKTRKIYPSRFIFKEVDLNDREQVQSLISLVEKKCGRIDVLVNNAGIAREGVLALNQDDEIDSVIDTNLKSTIYLTKLVSKLMIQQRSGSVINISSIIGLRGYAGLSVYSASKAALIGFTQSLARELGRRGIRVNAIAPGYLETEMSSTLTQGQKEQIIRRTPLGRLGRSEDVAPLLRFLISDEAQFITGQTMVVDGGITV